MLKTPNSETESPTNLLKGVISKLSNAQREEIDVIDSIVNINNSKREEAKTLVQGYIEKHGNTSINFILGCIEHASEIRVKERESIMFLLNSFLTSSTTTADALKNFEVLRNMSQVKGILPKEKGTDEHVFDFAEEGTVGRFIFEDDVDSLQRIIANDTNGISKKKLNISNFLPSIDVIKR